MSEISFVPRVREDGSLDPACLEEMGERWLARWLRNRLEGRDPYFPLDRKTDEDPEGFVVDLLRREGTNCPFSMAVGRAALDLLEEARRVAPESPAFLPGLLHLAEQVRLPPTAAWFLDELALVAREPSAVEARWGSWERVEEILFAALQQVPALPDSPAHELWLGLLRDPRFTTFALLAFGPSFAGTARHLAQWWAVCSREERERELSQMVFQALATEGETAVRGALAAAGATAGLPADLTAAIDSELLANGAQPVFAPPERQVREPQAAPKLSFPTLDRLSGLAPFADLIHRVQLQRGLFSS